MPKQWILTPDRFLKEEEVNRLRELLEEKAIVAREKKKKKAVRDWAMIDIALSAGLRASEIRELKVKDVHIGRGESFIYVERGKGDKSRLVTIGDKLKRHLKEYIVWKEEACEPLSPESYLFRSERGEMMTLSAVQKRFKHWASLAGLNKGYSIHSLRHTYGTQLYRLTKDLRMVQRQLGHSSCHTTEVYASVLDEDVEKAVNLLYV